MKEVVEEEVGLCGLCSVVGKSSGLFFISSLQFEYFWCHVLCVFVLYTRTVASTDIHTRHGGGCHLDWR